MYNVADKEAQPRLRWLCWLLLPWVLVSCYSVDPVLKVGLVGPFEGRDRAVGYDVIYSARLAVRQINEAGGIQGHRLALVALDDGGDPELAAQVAAALVIDPGVIAVVGHWLPETTTVAAPIYAEANMPFLAVGEPPFAPVDPSLLPIDFHMAYEVVTPFDEVAGFYAGPAYDAYQLLWQALKDAEEMTGTIDRIGVENALSGLEYEGLTGLVYGGIEAHSLKIFLPFIGLEE